MKNYIQKNRQLITGVLVGAVAIFLISSMIVEKRLSELQNVIEVELNSSAKEMMKLAESISRGEANAIASRTISDCTVVEQTQFDNRLGRLDAGLSPTELRELNTLFSRCAPVSVIRRSAMVVQLETEFSKYNLLYEQANLIGDYEELASDVIAWDSLLAKERAITDLLFDLVNLQYEIIQQLISGIKVDSESANELKSEGLSLRTELNKLIDETVVLREGLK